MQTRRNFLKAAVMLTGAAGFAAGVPDSIRKAYAIAPDPGTTWEDAEHIVLLMQENRSFDHALGTLQGVRGFNDPRAIRQPNGDSIFLQTSVSGDTYAPFRLDIKDTKITWMGSIPHSRDSQVDAWNHGHHNAWIDAKRSGRPEYRDVPITMGHYTREDIPFYYALADGFTVCDSNYCGVMTSTMPNRSLFWTGTIRDEQKSDSAVYMRNEEFHRGFKWKTFPERLSEAGIDWKIYQNELAAAPYKNGTHQWLGNTGNVQELFAAYHVELSTAGKRKLSADIEALQKEIAGLNAATPDPAMKGDHLELLSQKNDQLKALQKQVEDGSSLNDLTPAQQDLHRRAFVTNVNDPDHLLFETLSYEENGRTETMKAPKGDIFYQFRKDVSEGKLPTVTWITPPGIFSDHPAYPWYGAWYVSEAVDILTSNPEIWKKTIFIVTYDENDGYFDHAPSYVAPNPKDRMTGRASEGIDTSLEYSYVPDEIAQGVKPELARSGPIGLGFRVPMLVVSPWSRGGWVNSQVFDQTSTLRFVETFIEKKFGKSVRETNLSEFRRTVCGDLTSCFRPADASVPALPFLERDKHLVAIQRAKFKEVPSNHKKLSPEDVARFNEAPHSNPEATRQEVGIRPANALPYELYCEGHFEAESQSFHLNLRAGTSVHGARSAGAPFNVYLRNTVARNTTVLPRGQKNDHMFVATYVVKAGDKLQESFPLHMFADGRYEIDVLAPNGFFRSFSGSAALPVMAQCVYERQGSRLNGNVVAHLKNTSAKPVSISVTDNAYKIPTKTIELKAGQEKDAVLELTHSHGWYDFSVSVKGIDASVRYAGHVETGVSSFTDPVMGQVIT